MITRNLGFVWERSTRERRDLSLVEEKVKEILNNRYPLKKMNKLKNGYEDNPTSIKKVTAERTLMAALSLLLNKSKESTPTTSEKAETFVNEKAKSITNLNMSLIRPMLKLLPRICRLETREDLTQLKCLIKATNIDFRSPGLLKDLILIIKLLFELKSHADYQVQQAYSIKCYPRTFVKALYALFLMDLANNNLVNDIKNNVDERFEDWSKKRGLNQGLITKSYYLNSVHLQRVKYADGTKGILVQMDMDVDFFVKGVEFNIIVPSDNENLIIEKPNDYGINGIHFTIKKLKVIEEPKVFEKLKGIEKIPVQLYCAAKFKDLSGDIALGGMKGNTFSILTTLIEVGAIIIHTDQPEKTINNLYSLQDICSNFHEEYAKANWDVLDQLSITFTKLLTNLTLSINQEIRILFLDGLFNYVECLNDVLTLELLSFLKGKGLNYHIILSERDFGVVNTISNQGGDIVFTSELGKIYFKYAFRKGLKKTPAVPRKIQECYLERIKSNVLSQSGKTVFASSLTTNGNSDIFGMHSDLSTPYDTKGRLTQKPSKVVMQRDDFSTTEFPKENCIFLSNETILKDSADEESERKIKVSAKGKEKMEEDCLAISSITDEMEGKTEEEIKASTKSKEKMEEDYLAISSITDEMEEKTEKEIKVSSKDEEMVREIDSPIIRDKGRDSYKLIEVFYVPKKYAGFDRNLESVEQPMKEGVVRVKDLVEPGNLSTAINKLYKMAQLYLLYLDSILAKLNSKDGIYENLQQQKLQISNYVNRLPIRDNMVILSDSNASTVLTNCQSTLKVLLEIVPTDSMLKEIVEMLKVEKELLGIGKKRLEMEIEKELLEIEKKRLEMEKELLELDRRERLLKLRLTSR